MTLFDYKAKDASGKIVTDTMQANSREDAAAALRAMNLQVLTVNSLDQSGLSKSIGGNHISVSDKAVFCRFMSTMLRSGLSIPEAIEIIRQETKKPKMKKVLADLAYQTQKGKSITSVLSQYKEDFDSTFLTMVRVGEESGTLDKSFEYLTKQLSASHELNQKVKGSLMYPAVIVVAMIANGIVMMVFVLPRIAGVFLKLDIALPFVTRIILTTGDLIGKNVFLFLGFVALSFFGLFMSFYLRTTRNIFMRFIRRMPVVKNIVNQIDIARFSRTLSTLLHSGVPITTALDVSAQGLSDDNVRAQAKNFSEGVARGESLSAVLTRNTKLFPTIMIQTIKAGEKTGSLDQILAQMADFYESEVDYSLKRATSLLEPVLMLFIGIVVGGMVIIMIAPIYGIIGGLQQQVGAPQ